MFELPFKFSCSKKIHMKQHSAPTAFRNRVNPCSAMFWAFEVFWGCKRTRLPPLPFPFSPFIPSQGNPVRLSPGGAPRVPFDVLYTALLTVGGGRDFFFRQQREVERWRYRVRRAETCEKKWFLLLFFSHFFWLQKNCGSFESMFDNKTDLEVTGGPVPEGFLTTKRRLLGEVLPNRVMLISWIQFPKWMMILRKHHWGMHVHKTSLLIPLSMVNTNGLVFLSTCSLFSLFSLWFGRDFPFFEDFLQTLRIFFFGSTTTTAASEPFLSLRKRLPKGKGGLVISDVSTLTGRW